MKLHVETTTGDCKIDSCEMSLEGVDFANEVHLAPVVQLANVLLEVRLHRLDAGNEPLQPLVGAPRLQADSPASRATLVASTAKLDVRR